MQLLIIYDIRNDKRRRNIDKSLSAYGFRVNFSAFEIDAINNSRLTLLRDELLSKIDKKVDSLRIYHFNKHTMANNEELGQGREPFIKESGFVL